LDGNRHNVEIVVGIVEPMLCENKSLPLETAVR
jgi:hypothetical protein